MPRLLALAPVALLAAGCGRLDEVVITRTASATIPGAPGGAPLTGASLGGLGLMLDASTLQQHGIPPSDVDSARLEGLRLDVTGGTSFDAWLRQASVYLEAPGLPRVLVAAWAPAAAPPAGTTTLELSTFGVDLKPYALAPSSSVTVEASGTLPPTATTVAATATIRVNVNVSGLLP